MNRLLSWRDHLRFRWASRRVFRRDMFTAGAGVIPLIAILAAYAIAGTMDYQDALLIEAETQARNARVSQERLLACLNGGAPGLYTTDKQGHRHYIVCDTPFTVSDEGLQQR